jgi:DNA repair exonuclease SbcCD nuclease subunit
MQVLKEVLDYASANDADVLFNGDLFHKRGVVDVRVFNHVYDMIAQADDLTIYMVRGNHDSLNNSIKSPSILEPFEELEHVHVIQEMEVIETTYYNLYGVGYGDEVKEQKEWIREKATSLPTGKVNILCAHIGVDGAKTGKYSHTLEGAFSIADLYPHAFDIVTLGHYHKRQFLGDRPNVFYVGNTLQTSFADEGQDKGFYFIKLSENTSEWEMEFIKTTYRPFITITADNAPKDMSNMFVQFIGNPIEAKVVTDIKEKEKLDNIRVTVQKDYSTKPRIDISAGSTPEEVVRAYTGKNNPKLEAKALECLKEAMEV